VLVALMLAAGTATAAIPAAGFAIHSFAIPSDFSVAKNADCARVVSEDSTNPAPPCDAYQVTVRNAGSQATDGSTITLADTLPAGVALQSISFNWSGANVNLSEEFCSVVSGRAQCRWPETLRPDETLEMKIFVTVEPGALGDVENTATVSGGGALQAASSMRNPIGSMLTVFGVGSLTSDIAGVDGAPDTQAGSHPYGFTTRLDFNTGFRIPPNAFGGREEPTSVRDVKDVVVDLPLGFVGSALAAPKCTLTQLSALEQGNEGAIRGACPADTTLGHIRSEPSGTDSVDAPLYNMVPEHGVAAEFGYVDAVEGAHVLYASVVPSPSGYVLRTTSTDVPQVAITNIEVTLFGDPAAADGSGNTQVALFTNPSDCSGEPLVTSVHMDSWQSPGRFNADGTPDFTDPSWVGGVSESPPVTGCNQLRFDPSLSARPDTTAADSPSGLDVDLKIPQSEEPGTLATPPLRNAAVTLPAGLTLDPSAAAGLGACNLAQIDLAGAGEPSCPESSKIGTVELSTPLLDGTLTGSIYLATQGENPFHSLLAGYIVVDDPTTGAVIKIPGNLTPDPNTGQITGVFDNNPQFPFSDLKLHFFGGARGELATPAGCGTYTTTSDLMPWSAPDSGPDAMPSDSFPIDTGCMSGFAPSFTAGSENPQAGGYSPFTLSLSRTDGDQNLSGLSVSLPPGSLAKVAGVPLCPDANANGGTCPEASQVGTMQVGAGVGPNPLFVSGKVYLTGPYKGGPYGLVVEVPAIAGPFNLGTVVVRQSLRIDPTDAHVTAVSDPLPTILDGIPLRVRRVDVTLDRAGFTFNPTNCTPMAVTGTMTSTEGVSTNVSSRFQAGGCGELPFNPKFTVSTQARTSKKNGASLDVKVGYPQGPEANIHSVAVVLPKQLPSRLSTIQQACPEATFDSNPASCPAGSNIGIGTARTPVLSNPLTGPAYLVSHGGAGFPDLVLILQGEGVTLNLVGSIDIKHSITSSTFANVPDAPISSFELSLPEGPHSGLGAVVPAKAKGNLCGQVLTMPTTITGQNGAQVKQSTKITVTGCPKAKKKAKAKRHAKKGGKK
jgi:uncharacterized repeat protein (TIGR01451 family)